MKTVAPKPYEIPNCKSIVLPPSYVQECLSNDRIEKFLGNKFNLIKTRPYIGYTPLQFIGLVSAMVRNQDNGILYPDNVIVYFAAYPDSGTDVPVGMENQLTLIFAADYGSSKDYYFAYSTDTQMGGNVQSMAPNEAQGWIDNYQNNIKPILEADGQNNIHDQGFIFQESNAIVYPFNYFLQWKILVSCAGVQTDGNKPCVPSMSEVRFNLMTYLESYLAPGSFPNANPSIGLSDVKDKLGLIIKFIDNKGKQIDRKNLGSCILPPIKTGGGGGGDDTGTPCPPSNVC